MKPRSHEVIERLIPPLAVWAVGRVLEVPRVQRALHDVDRKFYTKTRRAERNAAKNRTWLAAGAAAIIVGISLMARASKK